MATITPPRALNVGVQPSKGLDDVDMQMTEQDENCVFQFNVPTYYDLRNPEQQEKGYVNNADGYFTPQTPATPQFREYRTPVKPTHVSDEEEGSQAMDEDMEMQEDVEHDTRHRADDEEDRMSEASNETLVLDEDGGKEKEEEHEVLLPSMEEPMQRRQSGYIPGTPAPSARSRLPRSGAPARDASSKLFQPTQAYLRRLEAEQAARAQQQQMTESGNSHASRPARLTRPRSPKLMTSQKAARNLQNEFTRLSSTSRELQQVQQEKMQAEMERMKIWGYHERMKAQRPPTDLHQRSTKPLTIPISPHLQVGHRDRCFLHQENNNDDGFDCHESQEQPHPYIRPEEFLSRDYAYPGQQHDGHSYAMERTIAQSPFLETAQRASKRNTEHQLNAEDAAPPAVDYNRMRVNGITQAITPQLETDRRALAAATHRQPIEVIDSDEEELSKPFHAKPLNKRIFQKRPTPSLKPKRALTKPVSPKFATNARLGPKQIAEEERARKELESRQKQQLPPRQPRQPHQPVIPETPQLTSIARHRQYQEDFKKRIEADEAELRRQREFKAKPMRLAITPPKAQGSRKPLTEIQPFNLESEKMHERARERMEMKRREEEEQWKAAAQFKAKPMPAVHDPAFQHQPTIRVPLVRPKPKALTRCAPPMLASDRRAAERAAFDAAERERRAREEALKRQMEEEARRREEEEVRRMRREQLVFHARPAPQVKHFELKPAAKPLTEPMSPFLLTRVQSHRAPAHSSQ